MNKYENEQFKVDEFSKVEEYQRFKAEDFKSLELFSVKKEEYKVELSAQGPLDRGLPTENKNYWQNTDVFKLCVSYL